MNNNSKTSPGGAVRGGILLPFDRKRVIQRLEQMVEQESRRPDVVAVVTVSRYVAGKIRHVQRPVFANQIIRAITSAAEDAPELSDLLADGAVDANIHLDCLAALSAARPISDFGFEPSSNVEADA